ITSSPSGMDPWASSAASWQAASRSSVTRSYVSGSRPRPPLAKRNRVPAGPLVDRGPVEVGEERVDVGRAVGLVVEEVRVLVDVERDQRRRIPDRIRVLRVADVVEQPALVPVVGGPGPPASAHPGRSQVGLPVRSRAKIALDQLADLAVGVSAVTAEMLEVDLVVLDPADREREVNLERADLGVDLVRGRKINVAELSENLVPLRDVALVELVVRLDRLA